MCTVMSGTKKVTIGNQHEGDMEGPVTFEGNNNVETSDSGEYAVGGKSKGKVLKGGSVKFNETNTVT